MASRAGWRRWNLKDYPEMIFSGMIPLQKSPGPEALRNILIVAAHPDDWECGMGGTALLLKDKYRIHVCITTRGQRGLGKEPSEETVKIRAKEAANACEKIGAKLYFLDQMDGDALAGKDKIGRIVQLLKDLDPAIIFTMWGIEVPDHAAVSAMTRIALLRTGMIHDREIYFFEAGRGGQTNQFKPDLYVNIGAVKAAKDELIRCHVCQNADDKLAQLHEQQNRFHGWVARCDFAEPFKTWYPLINSRWEKRPRNTLLDLDADGLSRPCEGNREVLIVGTHPDDWEIAMGGTALLMKDKFNMHVLILTRGEAALGGERRDEIAALRKTQAEEGCKKIGAQLHLLDFPDGQLTGGQEVVDAVLEQVNRINPGIIFLHWPMDKPDHAAAAIAGSKALCINGMIHDREIYYFGVQQETLAHFDPDLYVNISGVIEKKRELIAMHDLPSHPPGALEQEALETNRFFGKANRCGYAEGFRTHYPLVNHRWNKKTRFSLLNLLARRF